MLDMSVAARSALCPFPVMYANTPATSLVAVSEGVGPGDKVRHVTCKILELARTDALCLDEYVEHFLSGRLLLADNGERLGEGGRNDAHVGKLRFRTRCVASRIDRDRSRSPVWEIIRSRAAGAAARSALLRAVISFTRSVAFFRLSSSSWAVMFTFAIPSSMLMAFFYAEAETRRRNRSRIDETAETAGKVGEKNVSFSRRGQHCRAGRFAASDCLSPLLYWRI